jgi:ribose transport system substrate-binding protein
VRQILCLGAALTALLLAACGDNKTQTSAPADNSSAAAGKKIHLAFIPKGMENVYWKSVKLGLDDAQKEAQAQGINVQIDWKGPPSEDDRAEQIAVVEDFVGQGIDGLILAPMDADALVSPVEKATKAKIPVVIVDSALNYDKIASFVATDNKAAGAQAAEALAKLLNDKGNVLMMRFKPGSASTAYREDAFLEVMKKYPDIKVLSSDQYGGASRESSQDKGTNLLNSFKAQGVDGIFTPNEPTTNGMMLALEGAGLIGKVKFVGFDGGSANMDGLKKGEINALVLQDPYKMGYLGVKTMLGLLDGKTIDPRIDTGTVLISKENLDTPAVKDLLAHTVN